MSLPERIYTVFQKFYGHASGLLHVATHGLWSVLARIRRGIALSGPNQSAANQTGIANWPGVGSPPMPGQNGQPDEGPNHRHVEASNPAVFPRAHPPAIVFPTSEGSQRVQGADQAHPATQLTLNRRLNRSESDLGFLSLETIDDRGMQAHLSWERSILSPLPDTLPSTVQGNLQDNQDSLITFRTIGDRLCHAFQKSAFNERSYLPLDQLTEIVTPAVIKTLLHQHFDDRDLLRKIDDAMFGVDSSNNPSWPKRRRIFAILILAERVERIRDFIEKGVDDTALPFRFFPTEGHTAEKVLITNNDRPIVRWPAKVAYDFSHFQQTIHVPFLKFPEEVIYFYDLRHESILPFQKYSLHDSGGYSNVHYAEIHPAHHNNGPDKQGKKAQLVAVKQLHIPNRDDYLNEVSVFDKLGVTKHEAINTHLIPLQLTYKHGDNYFLIFPWADGNLKHFWEVKTSNPKSEAQVCWFFNQCWGIAYGLRKIHNLGTIPKDNIGPNSLSIQDLPKIVLDDKKWGRHNDIKPENILWFQDYEGKKDHLVISDFGLTRFNSALSKSRVPQDQVQGVTGTYQPPDLYLEESTSQKYDVWSLGCVLLEFTSWFLLGGEATVKTFATARVQDELESQAEAPVDRFFGFEVDAQGKQTAVLKKSVIKWIEKLHKSRRCTQPLHNLLDLIQYCMLVPASKDRWDSGHTRDALRDLHNDCKGKPNYAITPTKASSQPQTWPLRGVDSDTLDNIISEDNDEAGQRNVNQQFRGVGSQFDVYNPEDEIEAPANNLDI